MLRPQAKNVHASSGIVRQVYLATLDLTVSLPSSCLCL